MYILDKTETDDTPRILLFLCTNYNFRARESTPILRITGNDSVVSQACTPNARPEEWEFGRFVPWILTEKGDLPLAALVTAPVFTFPRRGISAR